MTRGGNSSRRAITDAATASIRSSHYGLANGMKEGGMMSLSYGVSDGSEEEPMKLSKTNCPNCGAPITDTKCPYCGTIHYDFANLKVGDISLIRLKLGDALHTFKAVVKGVSITSDPTNSFYADDYVVSANPTWDLDISMTLVQDVSGVLAVSYKREEER